MSDVQTGAKKSQRKIKCQIGKHERRIARVDIDPLAHQFDATAKGMATERVSLDYTLTVQLGRHRFTCERDFSTKSQAVNAAVNLCDFFDALPEFV